MHIQISCVYLIILLSFISYNSPAQILWGHIVNEQNEPVPYATIFIRELNEGTISNSEGNFRIAVPKGIYHLSVRSLGYLQIEKDVPIDSDSIYLGIVMQQKEFEIKEVLVFPGKEDPAYFIVRKAIANAAYHRERIRHYKADLYIKSHFTFTNIPRIYQNSKAMDGKKLKDIIKENMTYVMESQNTVTYHYPQTYHQEVISKRSSLTGFDEPPVMGLITSSFYDTRPNQVISPLSPDALKHYNYRYEGFITLGNSDVFKIKVEPKRNSDELVSGYMYIVDKLWCLYHVNFNTKIKFFEFSIEQQYEYLGNNNWMPLSHLVKGGFALLGLKGDFLYTATLKYNNIEENNIPSPGNLHKAAEEAKHTATSEKEQALREKVAAIVDREKLSDKDLRKTGRLNRRILKEQFKDTSLISNLTERYKIDDKSDSTIRHAEYWDTIRTIPLSPAEIRSFEFADSLKALYKEVSDKKEGTQPKNNFLLNLFTGPLPLYKDSVVRLSYDGLLNSSNFGFNAVDGYRLVQRFQFRSIPDSGKQIQISPEAGYAFNRHALLWNINARLENLAWNNSLLQIDIGKVSRDYKPEGMGINPSLNSTSSWLFGKNYIKLFESSYTRINIRQKISETLIITPSVEYNQFRPLTNHVIYKLSDKKEYEPNIPIGFQEGNTALAEQKSFAYGILTEYRKRTPKPWLAASGFLMISDFYSIRLIWNQGISDVFSSTSDFSHLGVGINHQAHLSPGAGINWQFNAGTFPRLKQLHFSQYKHFQTSEIPLSFKSFTHTFQLLNDYEPATVNNYLNAGAEVRFEYFILRYLSFLNQRSWSESLHVNYLNIPTLKNYWEAGYSLNSLFLAGNAGIFAGFDEMKFKGVVFKLSIIVF